MDWDQIGWSYDQVAAKYEVRFLDELDDKPHDRELLTAFAARIDDPVADLGCGPGQIGAFVGARGHRVVGVDLSPRMARLAGRRLAGATVGDLRALPLAPSSCGGLLAFYCLIHVPRTHLHHAFEEFRRVLQPSGRVLLAAHEGQGHVERDEFLDERVSLPTNLFELEELTALSQSAGLELVHAERRSRYEGESLARLFVEARRPAD